MASDLSGKGGIQRYNRFLLKVISEIPGKVRICELKRKNLFSKLIFILKLKIKLLFFRPDFVFCGHVNFAPSVRFFKRFFGYKYGVMAYGIDVWDIKERKKIRALREADRIFPISNYTKNKLLRQIPEIKNKSIILPNPIDGEKFLIKNKPDYLLERHNLRNVKIILTVARLSSEEKYKGYDQTIKSLPLVIAEVPEVKYVIVGEGDDKKRTENLIKEMNLENQVIMTGCVSDKELVDYYNLCDVFVMPSKGEGFGFVFLEALSCGKSVVVGNSDGSRDAVLDGKLGILVNPDSQEEIAEAIVRLIKKEAPASLLDGNFLRKSVLENYGLGRFKDRVRGILSNI